MGWLQPAIWLQVSLLDEGRRISPFASLQERVKFFEASRVGFVTGTEENRNQSFLKEAKRG